MRTGHGPHHASCWATTVPNCGYFVRIPATTWSSWSDESRVWLSLQRVAIVASSRDGCARESCSAGAANAASAVMFPPRAATIASASSGHRERCESPE